jgi:hypothetical protein
MLQSTFSGNGSSYDKARLINLSRVIFIFATRFIDPAIRPGKSDETAPDDQKAHWEFKWYFNYLSAVLNMAVTVQDAILAGKLTPRNVTTRAPLSPGEPKDWLSLDIDSEIRKRNDEFWDQIRQQTAVTLFSLSYPDGAALGPNRIGFDLCNLLEWLDSEQIASVKEARHCLSYPDLEDQGQSAKPTLHYSAANQPLLPVPRHILQLPSAPSWKLKKPERIADPLAMMIYAVLKDAYNTNEPCPKARDVLDRLAEKRPPDFLQVVGDSISFLDADGNAESANIGAVRNRINRMTAP